ncbi:uncharacterized protein, partial [Musca autumnalis]|uniref:uncharacterized protein n=1 Tax=Musca autumnalis TaxID=221902 RepID=UPI003CF42039
MKAVLVHQECWDVVCGSSKKPEKDYEAWVKKDEKALATIILSIAARQISYIKTCKSSLEAWNTLKDVHRPKGPVRKVTLFKQLLGMRMGEGDCVQQHVCKFAAISDKLAETGIELQEELFVIMLLASLPKSYENFVVALETRDELPSLSALKIKLAEEGERRKANGSIGIEAAENAFVSHSKSREGPRKFYANETFEKFKEFKEMVERQTGRKIKCLRSDNGTEFVNNNFNAYLKEHGIVRQLTVPHTPQQNGVAERFNRTLVEMARSMLVAANLDESLWAEAVNTAAYLRNRSPTKALDDKATPYEMWYNKRATVKHLKIFGSTAIALNKKHHHKFRAKGEEYVVVGYSETSKAYRLFDKTTRKVVLSRDVYFIENINDSDIVEMPIPHSAETNSKVSLTDNKQNNFEDDDNSNDHHSRKSDSEFESAEEDNTLVKETEHPIEEGNNVEKPRVGPGRPRIVKTGKPGRPKKQYNVLNLMKVEDIVVPNTVEEAMSGEHSQYWQDAMEDEYNSLMKNDTWELCNLPTGQRVIGC